MASTYESELAKKLNLKSGMTVRVIGQPADVELPGLTLTTADDADGIIVFVKELAEVEAVCEPVVEAAKADRIAWMVYPKAGQLGTDLNRDILWRHMQPKGVQGVRQIAIDEVWSAMRFRGKE